MVLSFDKERKDYTASAKKGTYLAVHQDVHDLIKYYAIQKNITVVQATYEVIRGGFKHMGCSNKTDSSSHVVEEMVFIKAHCYGLGNYAHLSFKTMCPSLFRVSVERFVFSVNSVY